MSWRSIACTAGVSGHNERPVKAVPLAASACLLVFVLLQCAWSLSHPLQRPSAAALGAPPSVAEAHFSSLNEPLAYAKLMNLTLQAYDNQPGISLPFRQLDYVQVTQWLDRILELDVEGQYPLLAASRLYGAVDDPVRQRLMLDFVHRQFLADPNRRWQWLAHAAYIARHQLGDLNLAVRYAESLRIHATAKQIPAWAKQMEIFLRADMSQTETAKVLLGALLASGQVTDPSEYRFLAGRLQDLEAIAPASPK